MSKLCLSSPLKSEVSSLLLSDFVLFCSFILSHPLYFSYFIFFSPYLLKLLSFLSPLFITTSLLLLAFLTVSPGLFHNISAPVFPEAKVSFLLTAYHIILEQLRSKVANEADFHCIEELEAYKIVFDTSEFDIRENPDEALDLKQEENCFQAFEVPAINCSSSHEFSRGSTFQALAGNSEEKTVEFDQMKSIWPHMEEERLQGFLKELDEFESMTCNVEEKKILQPGSKSDKVDENREELGERSGSEAMGTKVSNFTDNGGGEYTSKITAFSPKFNTKIDNTDNSGEYTTKLESSKTLSSSLGSYGSLRKEKEWKRTLACKLFEERHNVDGGEGMDLLWETYEMDSSKAKSKSNLKKKNKKKVENEFYEDDNDAEEEEEMNGQLCCLQALKFSAGKMNLGMGRPNLVKISKAIKGFGWLHHVSRHAKKVHNGDGF